MNVQDPGYPPARSTGRAAARNNRRPLITRRPPNAQAILNGNLSATPLLSLCATLEAERQSAVVRILTEEGPGQLWFQGGSLVDAEFEGAGGEGALCRLLALQEGKFDVFPATVARPRAIQTAPTAIDERRKTRTAEWSRLLQQGPRLEARLRPAGVTEGHTPLLPSQLNLLLHFDGTRSVAGVIEAVGGDAIETLRDVVSMVQLGVLTEASTSAKSPASPNADPTASRALRLATGIWDARMPKPPAVPRFDLELAPSAEDFVDLESVDATHETCDQSSRYANHLDNVEVVRVPDRIRPSSSPPPPSPRAFRELPD